MTTDAIIFALKLFASLCSAYTILYAGTAILWPEFHLARISLFSLRGIIYNATREMRERNYRWKIAIMMLFVGSLSLLYSISGSLFLFFPAQYLIYYNSIGFPLRPTLQCALAVIGFMAILTRLPTPAEQYVWAKAGHRARRRIIEWLKQLSPELRNDFIETLQPTSKSYGPFGVDEYTVEYKTKQILFAYCHTLDETMSIEYWNRTYGEAFQKPAEPGPGTAT
jgi:hypothetical protein